MASFDVLQYLRSVNCTLELITALRHRGASQRTIILLESLNDTSTAKSRSKGEPLTAFEALGVANVLLRAIPGLIVAKSVPELLDAIDEECIRSIDDSGTSSAIAWWARHGKARVTRVGESVRVVPPLLHDRLHKYHTLTCSCTRRKRGDVVGGFTLLRGDGSAVHSYQPPSSATLTMFAVLFVEGLVYLHSEWVP